MKEMKDKAAAVRQKMGAGQTFLKRLELTGKRAVIKPGGSLIVRLLPRWDLRDKYKLEGGKYVGNPDYKGGAVFFAAYEHWWDGDNNTRVRAWCPVTFDSNASCPVCDASEEHRQSFDQEDKKYGAEIGRKEIFLFNAIAKDTATKKRALTDEGVPDIRVMVAHGTVFVGITDVMFGGGDEEFARNDITNVREGYDIMLTRPAIGGGGDRWKVSCAPKPSPLVTEEERVSWPKDWVTLLVDLPTFVRNEVKSYDELYKLFHGTPPAVQSAAPPAVPATPPTPAAPASPPKAVLTAPAPAAQSRTRKPASAAAAAPTPPPAEEQGFEAPPSGGESSGEPPWGFEF